MWALADLSQYSPGNDIISRRQSKVSITTNYPRIPSNSDQHPSAPVRPDPIGVGLTYMDKKAAWRKPPAKMEPVVLASLQYLNGDQWVPHRLFAFGHWTRQPEIYLDSRKSTSRKWFSIRLGRRNERRRRRRYITRNCKRSCSGKMRETLKNCQPWAKRTTIASEYLFWCTFIVCLCPHFVQKKIEAQEDQDWARRFQ